MAKRSVKELDVTGKRVLVRADFNVELKDGKIANDNRLRQALPTINYLRDQRARIILCSHLGRPDGKVVEGLRLKPVADRLSELLRAPVAYVKDCVGLEARAAVDRLQPGQVLLLENLRFHPEEEKNDDAFARQLAGLADLFVQDGFGVVHRAHASTDAVTRHLPSAAGLLLAREIEYLSKVAEHPEHPYVAVMGGAKVSDKMKVLVRLVDLVDRLLIGGGMVATVFKAEGVDAGGSKTEDALIPQVQDALKRARARGVQIVLPEDLVVAEKFAADAQRKIVQRGEVPAGWLIMDIGPKAVESFKTALKGSRTVVWNGPMGVFEWQPFGQGTRVVAEAIASLPGATTVVGGGSTAEAAEALGVDKRISHVSTGGGASLEFLEGCKLPGIAALPDAGPKQGVQS